MTVGRTLLSTSPIPSSPLSMIRGRTLGFSFGDARGGTVFLSARHSARGCQSTFLFFAMCASVL